MSYFERAKKFRAKKRLGQNFLTDENAVETILEVSNITKDDTVVEIGAGLGFVTEQLVKLAKKVYAVELDEDMIKELQKIDADNRALAVLANEIKGLNYRLQKEAGNLVSNIIAYIFLLIPICLLGLCFVAFKIYEKIKNRKIERMINE